MEETEIIQAQSQTAECGVCGGHMAFDPQTQSLKCPFCGSESSVESTTEQVKELDFSNLDGYNFNWNISRKVVVCEKCGGQTITDPEDETAFCSFCGSQHMIIREDSDMGMCPQALIPYKLTQDQAKAELKKWIVKRYLGPRDLKHRYLDRQMKGIYIPFWTFDANTYTRYSCDIGTYYYTGTGDKRQRHTKWRPYSGDYSVFFDDSLVCGISHENSKLIKKIEPYDMGALVDYAPSYIAGFYAQKYVVMPQQAYGEACKEMAQRIQSSVTSALPGDTNRNYMQDIRFSDVTFKHVLLPIYMMTYIYNNKLYNVMVNGQTGEVQGQAPLSPIKVALLALLAVALVILFFYFYQG